MVISQTSAPTLQEGFHANLPVGIVLAGKHGDLTKTRHGRQVVFEPVKVLKTTTKLWYQLKDQIGDQSGVNESLKFEATRGGWMGASNSIWKTEEKIPDYTQRTSDEEYLYRIAQNDYRH